jgi:hypothetical protein
MANIPIAEAIQTIRREIVKAAKAGENEDIKFELGPIELEFQVEIAQERSGTSGVSAGFNVWVIEAEVSGEGTVQHSRATTHTVKLTLNPTNAQGGPLQVAETGAKKPR